MILKWSLNCNLVSTQWLSVVSPYSYQFLSMETIAEMIPAVLQFFKWVYSLSSVRACKLLWLHSAMMIIYHRHFLFLVLPALLEPFPAVQSATLLRVPIHHWVTWNKHPYAKFNSLSANFCILLDCRWKPDILEKTKLIHVAVIGCVIDCKRLRQNLKKNTAENKET